MELLKRITCFPRETLSTGSRMWDLEYSNICKRGWLVNSQTYDAYKQKPLTSKFGLKLIIPTNFNWSYIKIFLVTDSWASYFQLSLHTNFCYVKLFKVTVDIIICYLHLSFMALLVQILESGVAKYVSQVLSVSRHKERSCAWNCTKTRKSGFKSLNWVIP